VSLASDQNDSPHDFTPISRRMMDLRETVLAEWEKRVRASVEEAESLAHPILTNTLPALYDNFIEALTPNYPRTSAAVATPAVAVEHGGERARLTRYEAQAVINEYQILRSTIIDILTQNNVQISPDEMQIIGTSIDASIRESVTAFVLAQSVLRERFIATIVHDVRNPLATANAAAQLIPHTTDLTR
jgi:signal transduction histidine kinase